MRVTGTEFCGRNVELAALREYMQSAGRVYLVGERRIGKTSLVFEAARPLKKARMIYVDLMAIKTVAEFSHRLAQGLVQAERQESRLLALLKGLASLRPSISVDPITNMPAVSFAPGSGNLPETLDGLFALFSSWKSVVVVFDEFQDILDLSAENAVMARLRGLIQQQETVAFVFCGSVRGQMEHIFTRNDSPFFNAAMRLAVGPMERSSFGRFLKRKFATGERRLAEGVLDGILNACHDNPGDVQRLCTALWQVTSFGQDVTRDHLNLAWAALLAMQEKEYELVLRTISSQQSQTLRALAGLGGESNLSRELVEATGIALLPSVAKALNGLIVKRLVRKEGTVYRICDPFLAVWLQRYFK